MSCVLSGEHFASVRFDKPSFVLGNVARRRVVGYLDVVFPLDKSEVGNLVDPLKFFDLNGLEIGAWKEVMAIERTSCL
jgi:hypothetical protein